MFACRQPPFTPSKAEQTKAYSQVIAEYIKAVSTPDQLQFDTLFIGDHPDLPEIEFPETIESKKIILMDIENPEEKLVNNASYVLINIAEQKFTEDRVEFILVTFHQGNHPQHNCYIDLTYNATKSNYELAKKIVFEYPYAKK
jgi:hypothetical protein